MYPKPKGGQLDLLDNEKQIFEIIPPRVIEVLNEFPSQFKIAEDLITGIKLSFKKEYKNVLILGVGISSNVAYKLLESININKLKIPVIFNSKQTIPLWVDKDTLVIAISHSGNSTEVANAVDKALKSGIKVFAITTGGKLKNKATHNKNIVLIQYKAEVESSMAVGYFYVFLVNILVRAGVLDICSDEKDCPLGIDWDGIEESIYEDSRQLGPDVKTYKNIAKRIAIRLHQHIPIIYGSNRITETIGYRLKSQICFNSNNFAHYHAIPEIIHSEISAWGMKHELREKFIMLFITDIDLIKESKTQVETLKTIFLERSIEFEEIMIDGKNDAIKSFGGIYLADWISIYLALLNGVDPDSPKLTDLMKNKLEQNEMNQEEEDNKKKEDNNK